MPDPSAPPAPRNILDAIEPARLLALVLALVCAGLALIGLFSVLYQAQATLPDDVTAHQRVLVAELAGPHPSSALSQERAALSLPGKHCRSECRSTFKAYSVDVAGVGADEALYLPFFDGAAAVYLGDRLVSQSGSLTEPLEDTTYRPMLFPLPESAEARLTIVVSSVVPSGGRLAPFFVGPRTSLLPAYRTASLLLIDLPMVLLGVLVVIGAIAALLFATGDRDRVYVWFLTLIAFIALRLTDVVLPQSPDTPEARNLLYLLATLGVVLASAGFVSRLASRPATRLDIALLALWVPLALLIWVGLETNLAANWLLANQAIAVIVATVGTFTLLRFAHHSHRLPVVVQGVVTSLLTLGLGLMLHDVWLAQITPPLLFPLSNLATAPIVAAFSIALAVRYGQLLKQANRSNAQLQSAVAATRAELESSYNALQQRRQHEAIQQERHRLLRDVHDGVGGRLAALALKMRTDSAVDPQLSGELDASVADLRLVIDSLDVAPDEDLGVLLGAMRERCEPWLNLHSIHSTWQLNAAGAALPTGRDALSLCRIVQEALNNVVRHAEAKHVAVSAIASNDTLRVEVSDNGIGMAAGVAQGRGARIMANRAGELGAALSIDGKPPGTRITLVVPIAPSA